MHGFELDGKGRLTWVDDQGREFQTNTDGEGVYVWERNSFGFMNSAPRQIKGTMQTPPLIRAQYKRLMNRAKGAMQTPLSST